MDNFLFYDQLSPREYWQERASPTRFSEWIGTRSSLGLHVKQGQLWKF